VQRSTPRPTPGRRGAEGAARPGTGLVVTGPEGLMDRVLASGRVGPARAARGHGQPHLRKGVSKTKML
jgi:hypothetical protein